MFTPCRQLGLLSVTILLLPGALLPRCDATPQQPVSDQDLPPLLRASVPENVQHAVVLQREFQLGSGFQNGTCRLLADFCSLEVSINGRVVCDVADYGPAISREITDMLVVGKNTVRLRITPARGPAAFAFALSIAAADQTVMKLSADSDWNHTPDNAIVRPAGRVPAEFWRGGNQAIELAATDNYQQWKQSSRPAAGDDTQATPLVQSPRFRITDGFAISLVRSAAANEGSWVSMAFDPSGRLTIAREDEGLLRFTLQDDRQAVATVEQIDDELQECRGLLYAHGSLYANANNSKALYRLTDTDGDDTFDQKQLLRESSGGVGHGRNDLALGPDGWIWAIHGDSVDPPSSDQASDLTSPLRDSAKGPALREGHVVRISPDGSAAELVCSGLRNPFGIAFNAHGDAFTYDADNEYDMGTPWYRGTRIWQLFPGADFGWRITQGSWPPYFTDRADNAVAVLETGKGSPTAIMFGDQLNFPPPWNQCLYVLDWAYGRVLAVHLTPRGATYRSSAEVFLQGIPLNVTDLATGPDGALYLITGGRKTQSALYRVTAAETAAPQVDASSVHAQAAAAYDQELRTYAAELNAEIRKGETFLRDRSAANAEEAVAWSLRSFAETDPHLRMLAHTVVEMQPQELWIPLILQLQPPSVFHEASLSVARAASERQFQQLLLRLYAQSRIQNEADDSAAARLRMISVRLQILQHAEADYPALFGVNGVPSLSEWLESEIVALSQLPWAASTSETLTSVRWRAVAALGEVKSFSHPRILTSLLQSTDQNDQLAAMLAIRKHVSAADDDTLRLFLQTLSSGDRYLGGDGMATILQRIREDAVAAMTETQRISQSGLLNPVVTVADLSPPRSPVHRYTLDNVASLLSEEPDQGDAAAGAAVFREALCVRCHRFQTDGFAYGPDLTSVSRRFSRRDLLRSILNPSEVVAEPWQMAQVVTSDGRVHTGRVIARGDYRSESLLLNTNPLNPSLLVEIDKKNIEELNYVKTSPMPERLLDGFTLIEIRDLLAYLERPDKAAAR